MGNGEHCSEIAGRKETGVRRQESECPGVCLQNGELVSDDRGIQRPVVAATMRGRAATRRHSDSCLLTPVFFLSHVSALSSGRLASPARRGADTRLHPLPPAWPPPVRGSGATPAPTRRGGSARLVRRVLRIRCRR